MPDGTPTVNLGWTFAKCRLQSCHTWHMYEEPPSGLAPGIGEWVAEDPEMNPDSISRTRDISVLQLLTRLVVETEKLIKLADDINQHASTPQAKSAMNLIGSEVNNILQIVKMSIDPLYNLYEIDSGMKQAKANRESRQGADQSGGEPSGESPIDDYDENALWSEVRKDK